MSIWSPRGLEVFCGRHTLGPGQGAENAQNRLYSKGQREVFVHKATFYKGGKSPKNAKTDHPALGMVITLGPGQGAENAQNRLYSKGQREVFVHKATFYKGGKSPKNAKTDHPALGMVWPAPKTSSLQMDTPYCVGYPRIAPAGPGGPAGRDFPRRYGPLLPSRILLSRDAGYLRIQLISPFFEEHHETPLVPPK